MRGFQAECRSEIASKLTSFDSTVEDQSDSYDLNTYRELAGRRFHDHHGRQHGVNSASSLPGRYHAQQCHPRRCLLLHVTRRFHYLLEGMPFALHPRQGVHEAHVQHQPLSFAVLLQPRRVPCTASPYWYPHIGFKCTPIL